MKAPYIHNKYSSLFRRMTERQKKIQAIVTNTLKQLNNDFSIISIFPKCLNLIYMTDISYMSITIVIENENKKYIIDIAVTFDYQENMYNANSKKIEKYCDLRFVIP